MTAIAADVLTKATIESRIAYALEVRGGNPAGASADRWRDVFVKGYLAGDAARSMAQLQTDIHTIGNEAPYALNRSRTDAAPPARRKSDAQDAQLAADIEAETARARRAERDRRGRKRPAAYDDPQSRVKP